MSATRIGLLLLCSFGSSASMAVDTGGSVKATSVRSQAKGEIPAATLLQNTNRLKADHDFGETVSIEFAYELGLRRTGALVGLQTLAYRIDDLKETVHREDHGDHQTVLFQNLDRAFVQWSSDSFDLMVGRQAFAFGSSRVINPTDVFVPYAPFTIDTEDRLGTDGIRWRYPLGDLSELDIGVLFGQYGKDPQNAYYVRSRATLFEQDMAIMLVRFMEHFLVGWDLQYSLGPIGGWVESAVVDPKATDEDQYSRISTGINVLIGTSNTYIFTEYHFSDVGAKDRFGYGLLPTKSAYQCGGVFLLGRHYLIPGVQWEITPLLGATASIFANLIDGSALVTPTVSYSLSDDLQAYLGLYLAAGDEGSTLDPSEFGRSPGVGYGSLRYYF